ncbi:MAG: monofunctional biosynthetic peptidoglycan transglycosylase [Thermaurantiacus tibetensis]|uniref:monofunctional biosynthetic peptidoglycan transglycosylase n=1 Tax=Thermaurantiacus tibetensis TaxID=2759035 RepID=UPI0018907686|nr:monofunctional biosynthetic peptidoglycan transglycosylase [Thermaurantiacus tibetensis]
MAGGLRRLALALVRLALALALLSVAWVAAYRFVDPPATSLTLRDRLQGIPVMRQPVPLAAMSPALARAVIAAEDSRFCAHRGFDVEAIEAAIESNREGRRLRGASTISQQVAKNAFLWPGRTWLRKGLEAWFTIWLELLWPKARVMEVYLNLAEWDRGVYGAEAAAQRYFGKSAARLTRSEAARLAAILPSPIARNAARPGHFTARYARAIEKRMRVVETDGLDSCLRR